MAEPAPDQPQLEAEIGRLGWAGRLRAEAAFKAGLEQRLLSLESNLAEVKTRLNGLLFFIAGTVVAQALLEVLG